ncbi:MAG: sigma-70 family RNA polymerase sigma factor [Okeania sp. SIO3I5]|uniref:sigma-70 family RNA polymerase sigma factor n=1 Tax=Okeania sp. SIO3I5 TaxID=2607805 RepID=UPI0013BE1330|nr:sigma-70 family RNA polymerase sigma factor [Okeania sp. SIO3I5]NEQ37223.1 sigma-70 family RNA polymerase sigma factor [Okeania sp. SIO3I5]
MRKRITLEAKFSTFIEVDGVKDYPYIGWISDNTLKINIKKIFETDPQINEQYLSIYFYKIAQQNHNSENGKIPNLQSLIASHHLSAYLEENCYYQALKIYQKLQPYNYNMTKVDVFLMAREVAANPETFKDYNSSISSFKTYAGCKIYQKVIDRLRQGREQEKYSDTGLLRNISITKFKESLNLADIKEEEKRRCLLAWQCFKKKYVPTQKQGSKQLQPPSEKDLEGFAKLYQKLSPEKEKITGQEIKRLLDICLQALKRSRKRTFISLDGIDIEKDWENVANNDHIYQQERLELQQQIHTVLVDVIQSLPDEAKKLFELVFGLNISQEDVGKYLLGCHQSSVGRRIQTQRKKILQAVGIWSQNNWQITLNSEQLKVMDKELEPYLENYFRTPFVEFLTTKIEGMPDKISLCRIFYGQCESKVSLFLQQYPKISEDDLKKKLAEVKQNLQIELEKYVADNYSKSLAKSESVKQKVTVFIENYLKNAPYANFSLQDLSKLLNNTLSVGVNGV